MDLNGHSPSTFQLGTHDLDGREQMKKKERVKNWLTRGQGGRGPRHDGVTLDAWGPQKTSLRCWDPRASCGGTELP